MNHPSLGLAPSVAMTLRLAFVLFFAGALVAPSPAAPIPEHPDRLTYPALAYEPPDPAEHRVVLKAGPVAYLVPDQERPLIQITLFVKGGTYLDPEGKSGLTALTADLLTGAGTGQRTAEQLEERLDFLAAQLDSGAEETRITVRLNLLSKDLDEGLTILREVLTEPRFQEDRVALARQQILQGLAQRNDDSQEIERRERRWLAYGETFWLGRLPTKASVESLTRDDLLASHRRWCHPRNLVVAVSGDFDRADMTARLEKLFAAWPFPGETSPAVPTGPAMAAPGIYLSQKKVNQSRVSFLLPGVMRDDPDMPAIEIMNDIFGGGGFTSRITNRVRSDEGLAYSVGSRFTGGIYFRNPFLAVLQTKSRTVAYAASLVQQEMKRIATEPVSDAELQTSKRGAIETFPETFATADKTAAVLADDELTGRYATRPDHWKTFRARIESVTTADVQRVAAKYLHPDKVVLLIVGDADEIALGSPDHPLQLTDLGLGAVNTLPQRDPLTLQPVPAAK